MEADEAAVFLEAYDAMYLSLGHGTDFVIAHAAFGALEPEHCHTWPHWCRNRSPSLLLRVGDQRWMQRQTRSKPLLYAFHVWAIAQGRRLSGKTPLWQSLQYGLS